MSKAGGGGSADGGRADEDHVRGGGHHVDGDDVDGHHVDGDDVDWAHVDGDHVDLRRGTFHGPVTGKVEHHEHAHYGPAPDATSALPAPPAAFTGRDADTEGLLSALGPEPAVLISAVAGLGGVGKTALALHVAHEARGRGWFSGGTLFLDLRGYDEAPVRAEQAVLSLLRALGVRDRDLPPTAAEQFGLYRSELGRREPLLIVLDNVSGPEQVVPLLPGRGGHRVLVTSRDSLDSLPVRQFDLDALEPGAAVELVDRTLRLGDPGDGRVTEAPEEAYRLVELCGCLPLGLKIAAAQLRKARRRPLRMLVAELGAARDRLGALRARGVDQYGRELALRPVFDVTYDRLGEEQAALFRKLSVVPGADFGLWAAQCLVGAERAALPLLDDLVAASLLTASADGERWRVHDLVREYAGVVVEESDPVLQHEARTTRYALLLDMVRCVHAANGHLQRGVADEPFTDQRQALAWLDAERQGLVEFALSAGSVEDGAHLMASVAIAIGLTFYLGFRGYFEDSMAVARAAQSRAAHLGEAVLEAAAWDDLGRAACSLRQLDVALDAFARAADLHRRSELKNLEARSLVSLALVQLSLGHLEEAGTTITRAGESTTGRPGDVPNWADAATWTQMGTSMLHIGQYAKACECLEAARDIFGELGARLQQAATWTSIGICKHRAQLHEEALEALGRGEELSHALDDWHEVGRARQARALVHQDLDRADEARAAFLAAADAYERAGAQDKADEVRGLAQ
ncbi:tetratricopeptide repeat protein [Streptomyces sp. NPDC059009]|uniref:tetratricopeptide repeat protein n=1 Tax=Streptomyces sp. NPDC059009 TaxID=3346694 RepID=UPI0036B4470C